MLLLFLAGGFALVVLELVITGHTEGNQIIGVVASVLGTVLVLAGLFTSGRVARWIAIALVVLSVTGVMGTLQHAQARSAAIVEAAKEGEEREEAESNAPPLAALSLSGLALMSALVIVARPEPRG